MELPGRDGGTGASGQRHRVVVSAAWPAALSRWEKMNKTWEEKAAGVGPRGLIEGASPSNGGFLLPRSCGQSPFRDIFLIKS